MPIFYDGRQAELEILYGEKEDCYNEIGRLKNKISSNKQYIHNTIAEIRTTRDRAEKVSLQEFIDSLRTENQEAKDEIDDLRDRIEEIKGEIETLKSFRAPNF